MTFHHLSQPMMDRVRTAAIDVGLQKEGTLESLNAGMPPGFVGVLEGGGGNRAARLLATLATLNGTRALRTGEVPLWIWLNNAVFLSGGGPEELVFREALAEMAVDGTAVDSADTDATHAKRRPDGSLEVAIGTDETTDARFLTLGAAAAGSVGLVTLQRHTGGIPMTAAGGLPDLGRGTGWLIAPTLVVTNRHVVQARLPGETITDVDLDLQCRSARIRFDHPLVGGGEPLTAPVVGCELMGSPAKDAADDLDYAVLRIRTDPPANGEAFDLRPLHLRSGPLLVPAGSPLRERVNLLQYPGGEVMKVGFRDNFVVTATDRRLSYLTDTARGASGAPVCDDLWTVVGLHRGWATIKGDPLRLWGQEIHQENYAIPIARILADIDGRAPALGAEIRAGQEALG